ncbi:hypothetical protein [Litoribacter populi]|uniref:hypothetical protein n=1 Tax=Litoribacter populi TaxID=2598460 RepID=UPI00117D408F|nr:hypothetical protein [Litoribacter populi]
MKVRVRVVRAVEDLEATTKYIEGHHRVLESYGVTKVTSADSSWASNPNVYLILFESIEDSRVLGGGRVQLRSEGFPLPFENAIYEIDTSIVEYMSQFGDCEAAEICGLWNSKEVAGYGIGSIYLVRIGVAIASQLNIKKLFGLCSPVTVKISSKVGYTVIKELGNDGTFFYPKEDLVATVMHVDDVENIPFAEEKEREFVFNVRREGLTHLVEKGPKGEMEVLFDLKIPTVRV